MKIFLLPSLLITTVLCALQTERHNQVPGSNVFIQNLESDSVSFGLSCDDRGSWLATKLEGRRSNLDECDNGNTHMWVHIDTDIQGAPHRESEVRVQDKGRYAIFFDQDQKQWDLKEM
jgi:hypothetical protein